MSAIDRAGMIKALPYARRYARALTGTQAQGDAMVADALRQVMAQQFPEGISPEAAELELRLAREHLREGAATRVLIIEDEPIIALDIQELVERCGHSVVGIAATETEAVEIARAERPGLVLADINLGAGGDGANAVARILRDLTAPVIFVTAYPERLLTGEAVEPAFVITKPFDPTTLAVATYQAVTRGVRPV